MNVDSHRVKTVSQNVSRSVRHLIFSVATDGGTGVVALQDRGDRQTRGHRRLHGNATMKRRSQSSINA